jgi:hypothetical protein
VILALSLVVLGLLYQAPRVVRADTQLGQRLRGVRTAHLVSDPVPGRVDYIFREKNAGSPSTITAYAPGGTLLCSIPPDPSQPIQDLIDVIDLDGDGNAEIVGTYGGNGATDFPALWIYNGNCTLRAKWNTPQATTLGVGQVKIYDVLPANGQKRIVFVPNTFPNYGGLTPVYFIDAFGNLIAQPTVPPQNSPVPDNLGFPGIAVANIDNAGGYEIVIIAKSRLLAFNQNGQKLYYRQFVDSGGTFINYNTENDKPAGSSFSFSGRRYGLFQFNDVNGDGDLELIVAADANNINNNIPGAVYEAYNLSASVQSDTYQPRMWQRWLPRADSNYFVTNNNPVGYRIGVSLDGIEDMNGDGIPEIMVTESDAATGNPLIKAINARTGAVTGTLINGILVAPRRLDGSQSLWDLIVYDNTVFNPITGMGNIKIFRLSAGTYTPFQLAESPAGSLANFAADIIGSDVGDDISLSDSAYLGTGITTGQGHFSLQVGKTNNVKTLVANTAIGCPSGLYSWQTIGGVVQPSLAVFPRPGELVSVLPTTDKKNHVWVLRVENSCVVNNVVRTAAQSGAALVPNGDL